MTTADCSAGSSTTSGWTTLAFDDLVLILHDLGGPVGVGAAADRADRIRGLVLANTFLWQPDTRGLRTMLRIVSSHPMTGIDRATGFIPRLTATGGGLGLHLDRPSKRAFVACMRQPRRTARFHRLMADALESDELYDRVEAATAGPLRDTPVLTIFGQKNDPFGFQERHRETFRNHRGIIVKDGNHFPMMDDPDLFAAEVTDWLVDRAAPPAANRTPLGQGQRSTDPSSLAVVTASARVLGLIVGPEHESREDGSGEATRP